mmetsp:Transcript_10490/g.26631  ORF Transcript_10490/g.26631 Transcript_10490/m.26631 type:complete len:147 (-) Transcript_10490:77-517(-)
MSWTLLCRVGLRCAVWSRNDDPITRFSTWTSFCIAIRVAVDFSFSKENATCKTHDSRGVSTLSSNSIAKGVSLSYRKHVFDNELWLLGVDIHHNFAGMLYEAWLAPWPAVDRAMGQDLSQVNAIYFVQQNTYRLRSLLPNLLNRQS